MNTNLASFTDVLGDEICNSQPMSLPSSIESRPASLTVNNNNIVETRIKQRPPKGTGQRGQYRSTEEIDPKYRDVFSYPCFNLVQSSVIEDALYSDKSIVVCAPTGSGKTVVFEMAIVQLLMEMEDKEYTEDFKIIYMAPVKALCTERLTEWYPKFTKLGLLCIEVTGDTDVDFKQLKPYKIIITTPEKWDMLTRRWRDHRGLVEVIKLFLIDEVHILNDELRGPVLETVVSRMKTIENSAQSAHRIEKLQKEIQGQTVSNKSAPSIRFVAVSATVSNPEDVANWLGTSHKPAVFYKFGDECRPVKLRRIVEGYPCSEGTSIFKFDIILNYKLWPVIQRYHSGKPTLIFCNTRKSVILTAETLSRELTINFNAEQKAKLTALASTIKNKKIQALVISGVGCHHAGLLYEERHNIEHAFRNRDLPILITTTTLAMGVNLPAHLVIVKNTQQYVNGAYQEYSISTVLQMVGRAGRPQFDTEATAVIMTRLVDKPRYQALVGGCEPLQSFLHKRLAENLNSEVALGTVGDVAQCVQWLCSTFLYVRAARDPKKYLGLAQNSPQQLISKKIEELCVKAMNGLASSGLITMDEASCIESTEAGRLMSIFYLDLETMKQIMKISGTESLERLLIVICESHELADMHLRVDERRCLNTLNRNNAAATIRFPMKGKISTRQMKLNCIIQAVLGCLSIPDPSLNQEAMKIMRIADRVCKCLVAYVTRPDLISHQPQFYTAVLNSIILAKCVAAHLWENSPFVSKQLKGIGPTFSTLLASAGKVNFLLLEESHPRDLERIMNKGAAAGNILRKQVSLLPKYQLTMIPVDEKTVTVQLFLLNQLHLAGNTETLTAGDGHKSYIIVGDSNNNLLLLATFKDKDLISIFDGVIRYDVQRKHNFEHKIFAHCISSSFVGIDVQSEYLFNDLDQFFGGKTTITNEMPAKKITERQTCITDTFKERKRKNTDAIDKTHSKEKKKRDNALIKNFKSLKESFETATKNLKHNVQQQSKHQSEPMDRKTDACVLPSNAMSDVPCTIDKNAEKNNLDTSLNEDNFTEGIDSDELIDEDKIDSLLKEIENEMRKNKESSPNSKSSLNNNNVYFCEQNFSVQNPFAKKADAHINKPNQNLPTKTSSFKTTNGSRKRTTLALKSNYNFIDLLERNLSLSDDDDKPDKPQRDNGFSDTIKSQIQKYLSNTQKKCNAPHMNVGMLLENTENELTNEDERLINTIQAINLDSERSVSPIHKPYPQYEIKEILGDTIFFKKCSKNEQIEAKHDKNSICNEDPKNCYTINIEEQNKFNNADISNCDTNIQEIAPLHSMSTTILFDNEDSTDNINQNKLVKQNNPSDTISIIVDRSNSIDMCTDGENSKGEVNQSNDIINNNLTNIICVKDNNDRRHRNDNRELCENKGVSDTNMINSSKMINEYSKTDDTHVGKYINEDSFSKMCVVGKKSNAICIPTKYIEFPNKKIGTIANFSHSDIVPIIRNSSVENISASHRDTLCIEGIDPSTHFKHEQCKQSFCNPTMSIMNPSSDFMNDKQNISSDSPKNMHAYKQKTESIRRYTYSSSKIDVCTKQNPEYCMQVIKKIKIDLDITAIVSRNHNYFQNYRSDNEETTRSRDEIKCMEVPKSMHTLHNVTRDVNKCIHKVNEGIPNTSKVNLQPARLSRSEFSTAEIHELPNKVIIQRGNAKNILLLPISNKRKDSMKIDKKMKNKSKYKPGNIQNPEVLQEDLKKHDDIDDDYENPRDEFGQKESEDNSVNAQSKIKNLLQQYSTILGLNTGKNLTPSCSNINKPVTCNKSPTIKSKKPFKITDIHKLHASLPNIIVVNKPEGEEININHSKINDFETLNNQEDRNSNPYVQFSEIRPIEETVPNYESITDLEPIHLPDNVELESRDFKIDQSMFDPKTLLQCVVSDDGDEIVPPPPEFCDGITCSPDYDNAEASMDDDNSQCFRGPQFDINCTEKDMEYNESIFDDTCATNLTPSREIETWNLSPGDRWKPRDSMNLSPLKSFTMMRKNTRNGYNFPQNSLMSMKATLRKFKITEKNKLKIRK